MKWSKFGIEPNFVWSTFGINISISLRWNGDLYFILNHAVMKAFMSYCRFEGRFFLSPGFLNFKSNFLEFWVLKIVLTTCLEVKFSSELIVLVLTSRFTRIFELLILEDDFRPKVFLKCMHYREPDRGQTCRTIWMLSDAGAMKIDVWKGISGCHFRREQVPKTWNIGVWCHIWCHRIQNMMS